MPGTALSCSVPSTLSCILAEVLTLRFVITRGRGQGKEKLGRARASWISFSNALSQTRSIPSLGSGEAIALLHTVRGL